MSPALLLSAVVLAARFGPNDIVSVATHSDQTRLIVYGDSHLVDLSLSPAERSACATTLASSTQGACTIGRGGRIEVLHPKRGPVRLRFSDAPSGNVVEFDLDESERMRALSALRGPG